MKENRWKSGRCLVLAVFVLAAGICYSCGFGRESGPAELIRTQETAAEAAAVWETATETAAAAYDASDAGRTGRDDSSLACYVYVCGEVRDPGVYRMKEGQRIYEAVELAGGFTDEAVETYLNLAEPVCDGMKIMVPDQEQAEAVPTGTGENAGGIDTARQEASGKVDLNTATAAELMTLRGIGEARAADIIAYRSQHGSFGTIEEIMKVPGIKEAAFEKIKNDIFIGNR